MAVGLTNSPRNREERRDGRSWFFVTVSIFAILGGLSQFFLSVNGNAYIPNLDDIVSSVYEATTSELTISTTETATKDTVSTILDAIPIRRWGCARKETPLIFVHVGKAGGGMVQARFAASARNYNRSQWHAPNDDQHYYPVSDEHNGHFCNSNHKNGRIRHSPMWPKTYEGNLLCNAMSPIGGALACPEPSNKQRRCRGCHDFSKSYCHQVYVGHNLLGSEMHWLPPKYLKDWWEHSEWAAAHTIDWNRIHEGEKWCENVPRLKDPREHNVKYFAQCSIPIGDQVDKAFNNYWLSTRANLEGTVASAASSSGSSSSSSSSSLLNYAPIYASLPLHRATLVRDPFSWLISKFFWHSRNKDKTPDGRPVKCDDIAEASRASLDHPGWAYKDVIQYLVYICGEDCAIRLEQNQISYDEIRIQSISNMKQSFSVVGLLNETDTFFDMVSARMDYVDMRLHPHVTGARHATNKNRETRRCQSVFLNATFQQALKAELPLLSILDEVYHIALEVNRDQLAELQTCPGFGQSKEY